MAKKIKASKAGRSATGGSSSQQRQQMMLVGGVVAVSVAILIGFIVLNQLSAGESEEIGTNETYAGVPVGGVYTEARDVDRAEDVAEGVERGIAEDGLPYIGDPNAAIEIGEIADFTCPACTSYHPTIETLIADFARSGEALFRYLPTPAASRDPAATNAARAAICAGEQGGFWELHDEIFRIHRAENPQAFTPERMEEAANAIGLDGAAVRECMNTNTADSALVAARRIAQEMNAFSTPTLLYRLRGQQNWNTLPLSDGSIGGGRTYEQMAELIRSANQQAN